MEQIQNPSHVANEEFSQEVRELIHRLPEDIVLGFRLYQNFWYRPILIPRVISFQRHFKSHDEDIIVASKPKSGTTWLKALVFSIVNRTQFPLSESPLLGANSHALVPFLAVQVYSGSEFPNLDDMPSPRLFGTHMPYVLLTDSIKNSKCRIVYICRNPLDTIVSFWHFATKTRVAEERLNLSLEEYADLFARGVSDYGPFWDHVLSYWKESVENPHKVLFLQYENMKKNTIFHVKRMAEFLGYPFSREEAANGVIEDIIQFCSIDNMKNLEGNKVGEFGYGLGYQNASFFRKGEVGDSSNYFSSSHAKSIKQIIQEKFEGTGLNIMLE